jgi:3-methyladenine DNA glycosylase AlkC
MPEALKNLYNEQLIKNLSSQIKSLYDDFDENGFKSYVLDDKWQKRELKSRMEHISISLFMFLRIKYPDAIQILTKVAKKFNGFEYMFFPGFVELYGLYEYKTSIYALEVFTKYSSSEFAVRPFIKKYPHKMMKQMSLWAESDNFHVRRLSSEGCRPRLPWAAALPAFKKDPGPIITILEKLKNDESEYVRRSVANNLNDISKDNPQIVIKIAKSWFGDNKKTNWIIKHGCRTLLKQGNIKIMDLFGFFNPEHIRIEKFKVQNSVNVGEKLHFTFLITTDKNKIGKIRIEYALNFINKNGNFSRKIFKITESDVEQKSKMVSKYHSFKKISTRKYYAGKHNIGIIINGKEKTKAEFLLKEK